jgi:glycosyltransferase involved in cell wall biosynthesis
VKGLLIIHIVPPYIEFPPVKYGGTERVAHYLVTAQIKLRRVLEDYLGVDQINIKVFARHPATNNLSLNPYAYALRLLRTVSQMNSTMILIHNHLIQRNSFLIFHNFLAKSSFRRVYWMTTLHYDPPLSKSLSVLRYLVHPALVAISKNQYIRLRGSLGRSLIGYVHNGIPVYEFPFCYDEDNYLISLAAITPVKGIHNVIIIAKRTGNKLVIGGPVRDQRYFNLLKKYIDNKTITYVGEVDENTKRNLLCRSKALLFPVEREEYFGLNIVEAMACGTPVLAFPKGAVLEIVSHGKTGFLGRNVEELISYMKRVDSLDPYLIRSYVNKHFSSEVMAKKYLIYYKQLLEGLNVQRI